MHNGSDSSSRFGAMAIKGLMVLGLLVGLALAAWLGYAAIPSSAWETARTPAISDTFSPQTRSLDALYQVVFWMATFVFVLVEGLIVWAMFRFRRKPGDPEPKQIHGNNRAEVAWTLIPAIIVSMLAWMGYGRMQERFVTDFGEDAVTVNAIGFQWWWEFEYVDYGFTTSTEMVLPVNKPVMIPLESHDVLHSFWVPELAPKYDAVPGDRDGGAGQNFVSFVPDTVGRYEGQCTELCGAQHAGMRFTVIVVEQDEFEAWAEAHAAVVELPELERNTNPELTANYVTAVDDSDTAEERGYKYFLQRCILCHNVEGVNTRVDGIADEDRIAIDRWSLKAGPNVTRMAARTFLAGGVVPHTPEGVRGWINAPQTQKPGTHMEGMGFIESEVDDILAWLYSMKIDDEVMRPVYAAQPRPDAIPPAYEALSEELLGHEEPVVEAGGHGEDE